MINVDEFRTEAAARALKAQRAEARARAKGHQQSPLSAPLRQARQVLVQKIRHATRATGLVKQLYEYPDFTPRPRTGDGMEYTRREWDLEQIRKELTAKELPE